jgi:hypothetical protein
MTNDPVEVTQSGRSFMPVWMANMALPGQSLFFPGSSYSHRYVQPHFLFLPGCWSQLRPALESLLSRELCRLAEHVRGKRGAYALSILLPDGFRNLSLALVRYFALPDNPWGERGPPVVTHPTYKTDWTEPRETYPVLILPLLYPIQYIHTQFHSLLFYLFYTQFNLFVPNSILYYFTSFILNSIYSYPIPFFTISLFYTKFNLFIPNSILYT